MSKTDFKKYLPSQKFVASLLTIVIVIAFGFLIKEAFILVKHLINKDNNSNSKVAVTTVSDIIQEDSNNNGIADWEEYIWSLDPTKNGPENKAFILAKKKSMAESGEIVLDESGKEISDNEMLSRSLLATILSLESSGGIDEDSLKAISETIGQEIVVSEIPDKYSYQEVNIVPTSPDSLLKYHSDFSTIYTKYQDQDVGTEITLISIGIGSEDVQSLRTAKTIAVYYRDFANELIGIETPSEIASLHLKIINDLSKIGDSVDGLAMSLADPMLGMKSLILYNKYSDDMITSLEEITNILQSN